MAPIYFASFPRHILPLYLVLYTFDWAVVMYVLFELLTFLQFLMAYTFSNCLATIQHLESKYREVKVDLVNVRKIDFQHQKQQQPISSSSHLQVPRVNFSLYNKLLTDHIQVARLFLQVNGDLFNSTMFFTFQTMLPINVYCVVQVVMGSQFGAFKDLYYLFILIITLVLLGCLFPAKTTDTFHALAKVIPNLQWVVF